MQSRSWLSFWLPLLWTFISSHSSRALSHRNVPPVLMKRSHPQRASSRTSNSRSMNPMSVPRRTSGLTSSIPSRPRITSPHRPTSLSTTTTKRQTNFSYYGLRHITHPLSPAQLPRSSAQCSMSTAARTWARPRRSISTETSSTADPSSSITERKMPTR